MLENMRILHYDDFDESLLEGLVDEYISALGTTCKISNLWSSQMTLNCVRQHWKTMQRIRSNLGE